MNDALETIRALIASTVPAGLRPLVLWLLGAIAAVSALALLLNPILDLVAKTKALFKSGVKAATATPAEPSPAPRRAWRVRLSRRAGLAVAASALVAAGLAAALAWPAPQVRGPDGCLLDAAPPAALLIVLDPSGQMSGVERAAVERLVVERLRALPGGAWVGLVGVEDHENEIALAYGGCVATAPRAAFGLGKRQAQVRFDASVQQPVATALAAVLARREARQRGPIIETILNAMRTPGFSGAKGERTVLLVSEGKQNTYKARLDYRDRDDIPWPAGAALTGAKFLFFQIHGDDLDAIHARAPAYWRAFATGNGATYSLAQ